MVLLREVADGEVVAEPTGVDIAVARVDEHLRTLAGLHLVEAGKERDFLLDLRNDLTKLS